MSLSLVEAGKNWYIIVIKLDVFFIVIGLKFCPIALISHNSYAPDNVISLSSVFTPLVCSLASSARASVSVLRL
jgi:hypothetical protein